MCKKYNVVPLTRHSYKVQHNAQCRVPGAQFVQVDSGQFNAMCNVLSLCSLCKWTLRVAGQGCSCSKASSPILQNYSASILVQQFLLNCIEFTCAINFLSGNFSSAIFTELYITIVPEFTRIAIFCPFQLSNFHSSTSSIINLYLFTFFRVLLYISCLQSYTQSVICAYIHILE